jgi:uncharacterized protein
MGRLFHGYARVMKPPIALVRWSESDSSASHVCVLHAEEGGFELTGSGEATWTDGDPVEIRFTVRLDHAFATREVRVRAGRRSIDMSADGLGGWSVEGTERADLHGCTDVDLEFTPATNTLPIRRLGLEPGQSAEIEAAWVRVPSLGVERSVQRYERLGERLYKYSSGDFAVELNVDEHGLVLDYPPFWVRERGRSQ